MMREYGEKINPRTREVIEKSLVRVTCDRCGKETTNGEIWPHDRYEKVEINVCMLDRRKVIVSVLKRLDLCPACYDALWDWISGERGRIMGG
jgi:hypothetical protein